MAYVERLVDPLIAELFDGVSAIMLTGPRASGKTTTARRFARSVVQLDDPAIRESFRQHPDAALRGLQRPILLDEWQAAPEVIGAVKRSVDRDPAPGGYLLTGSAATDLVAGSWPGTGRIVRVPMVGMTERELSGRADKPLFISRLLSATDELLAMLPTDLTVVDYVRAALRSGFPEAALRLSGRVREAWLASYLEECFVRDVGALGVVRDRSRLRRLFVAMSANTAGVIDDKTLYDAAQLDRKTAIRYEAMFEGVGIIERVPAYSTNLLKRLVERPKRYVVDAGLVGAALAIDEGTALRNADLLGRVIETFVVSQIRAEAAVVEPRARLHHLRTESGRHEVDVVLDLGWHGLIAIEIKATGAPVEADARHLRWLMDELGERVIAAVVLHTGPTALMLDRGVLALPIAAIWS